MSKDLLSTYYGHQGQELWSEVEAEEGATSTAHAGMGGSSAQLHQDRWTGKKWLDVRD